MEKTAEQRRNKRGCITTKQPKGNIRGEERTKAMTQPVIEDSVQMSEAKKDKI